MCLRLRKPAAARRARSGRGRGGAGVGACVCADEGGQNWLAADLFCFVCLFGEGNRGELLVDCVHYFVFNFGCATRGVCVCAGSNVRRHCHHRRLLGRICAQAKTNATARQPRAATAAAALATCTGCYY
jgi:hypothetical protein